MKPVGNTPVIVGVGQFVERIGDPGYASLSFGDLAAQAGRAALANAMAVGDIASLVGAVGAVRTFEESDAMHVPFGRARNFPRAVARRLGIDPSVAILDKAGGQSPLTILVDLAERIARGEVSAALAFGAEAISTVRHLVARGETRDWMEDEGGNLDDRGIGVEGMIAPQSVAHGLDSPPIAYALCENARRARLGLSRDAYAMEMGRLFAPFTAVAAANPYSAASIRPMSAAEIITPGERNRMIADPYPLKLVARDQVNQAAAVLLMSATAAHAAGIPEHRWVYVHGAALAVEREILERADIGVYKAAEAAISSCLAATGLTAADMAFFDFYSCFPAPVFHAADTLGLAPDDPRGLTVTGGLPYFGGAGNNYSMHAIATMVERLRAAPGSFGLIGLNGGFQSKYGAAIFSTVPCDWPGCHASDIQATLDEAPPAIVTDWPEGPGRVVTYTVAYDRGVPVRAIVIGELASGGRFVAESKEEAVLAAMIAEEPLGRLIEVSPGRPTNRFTLA